MVHLVLARTPEGSEGKRYFIFMVPKFHFSEDGTLGDRNDVICTKIEEKWASLLQQLVSLHLVRTLNVRVG